jgi:predicted DNA-binding protein YlxM (UPF0122 family)
MTILSDKIKSILQAAVETDDISEIASELNLSVQAVTGSIAFIKKANLAIYENKKLTLTCDGFAAINVVPKKKTNRQIVATLVAKNPNLPKADLVKLIAETLNKSIVDSRVYLYNYEVLAGLRTVNQKAA